MRLRKNTKTHPSVGYDCAADGPEHIAIIMDGNGRWANERGANRLVGHAKGAEAVRRTVRAAADINLKALTLFSFSTENWARPPEEVEHLMGLFKHFVNSNLVELNDANVRFRVAGSRQGLSPDVLECLERAEKETQDNTSLTLCIAFNYGGRDEIVRAFMRVAEKINDGALNLDDIDQSLIKHHLDCPDIPDPELIIRTSGEQRISNFLIWQGAYSELVFLDKNWPDFDKADLIEAIKVYKSRDRRFGAVKSAAAQ